MKRIPIYFIPLFVAFVTMTSCAEKQNFDQYDDLQIIPTAEASILYVESTESFINDETVSGTYYSEDFNFDAFSEQFVADQVLDGVITYEVENTTSKELEITIEFLDAAGNVIDTEQFTVPPAPTALLRREIAYGGASGRSIDILKNTSGIRMTGRNLGDTTSVSSLPEPKIIFRSSAKIRIQLK